MQLQLRWYGFLYVSGLCFSWILIRAVARRHHIMTSTEVDRLMLWMSVGCVFGGRVGYVLFYGIALGTSPIEAVLQFDRGMSFFGGLIAVAIVVFIFTGRAQKDFLVVSDIVAGSSPVGLFLGRIGNYMNGEIFGPPTSLPWGIVVPPDKVAQHPTQLYEALLEGAVLLAILYPILWFRSPAERPGFVLGLFLVLYSSSRILVEFLRDDSWINGFPVSISQILCVPAAVVGLYLIYRTRPVRAK